MKIRTRIRRYVLGGSMENHFELACAWGSLLIILATIAFAGWLFWINRDLIIGFIAKHI